MLVLDGKAVSQARRKKLQEKIQKLQSSKGFVPGLAVIIIGQDPASQVYVRNKHKACKMLGMNSWVHELPENSSPEQVRSIIESLNTDNKVHGILVQLPVPKQLNKDDVLTWIDPKKDADGLTVENLGLLMAGQARSIPCTPHGVMKILEYYDIKVEGKTAVVVGRSEIVGKPMALLLQNANATVTVCHSKTPDVSAITREADIVVVAAGRPLFLGKNDFKKGSVVIDVGIHRTQNGLCGDVRFAELDQWCFAATPVPGGVGPMTITMLLENTYELALNSY